MTASSRNFHCVGDERAYDLRWGMLIDLLIFLVDGISSNSRNDYAFAESIGCGISSTLCSHGFTDNPQGSWNIYFFSSTSLSSVDA